MGLNRRGSRAFTGLEDDVDELEDLIREKSADRQFREAREDAAHRAAFLARLVNYRKDKLTQSEVAERMGTTQSAVSDLEGGAGDPRLSTLFRYARAVDLRLTLRLTCEAHEGSVPVIFGRANPELARARSETRATVAARWTRDAGMQRACVAGR